MLASLPAEPASFPAVHEVRLPNGMKFLLVPRGEAPIFSAVIRFPVGWVDEEVGKTGLAHFMEHMAFKGTAAINELELTRRVEEEGGQDFNASTSNDATTYRVDFPADRLAFWAELESDRIFHPVFRDFDKERNVVLEERRMRVDDDPDGLFFEKLLEEAFAGTPYGWPTVGTTGDMLKLKPEDLDRFWREHYDPAGAVGVLVGKIDLRETERLLKRTFGKITSRRKRGSTPIGEGSPLK